MHLFIDCFPLQEDASLTKHKSNPGYGDKHLSRFLTAWTLSQVTAIGCMLHYRTSYSLTLAIDYNIIIKFLFVEQTSSLIRKQFHHCSHSHILPGSLVLHVWSNIGQDERHRFFLSSFRDTFWYYGSWAALNKFPSHFQTDFSIFFYQSVQ